MIVDSVLLRLLPAFLTVFIALIILFTINVTLSIMLILVLILYGITTVKKSDQTTEDQKRLNRIYEKVYGDIYEKAYNIEAVKENTKRCYYYQLGHRSVSAP